MRIPSTYSQRTGTPEIPMTPLIDVVFLLMVFFIWTAGGQIAESVLPSSISTSAGTQSSETSLAPPPEADFDNIVVRILLIEGRPAWQVNDAPVASLAAVRDTLAAIAAIKPDAPVILHPDPQVPLGDVIDVYDLSRQQGFGKVQFAASDNTDSLP